MSKEFYARLATGTGVQKKPFKSAFGARLLSQMGWKGGGLGANEDGNADCVQIKRRQESLGLGADSKTKENNWSNWWDEMYNSTVKKTSPASDASAASSESSDSEPESSSEAFGKSSRHQRGKLERLAGKSQPTPPTDPPESQVEAPADLKKKKVREELVSEEENPRKSRKKEKKRKSNDDAELGDGKKKSKRSKKGGKGE